MKIDLPDHAPDLWTYTPLWLFWMPGRRRRNWRWIIDHLGCRCVGYWEYGLRPKTLWD